MEAPYILMIIHLSLMFVLLSIFWIQGNKVLKIFPALETVEIKFREKWASGYSNDTWITKMGGAQKLLDVIVTQEELWIKSPKIFAGIAQRFHLIQRIKKEEIKSLKVEDLKMIVSYVNLKGDLSEVVLVLKEPKRFSEAFHSI